MMGRGERQGRPGPGCRWLGLCLTAVVLSSCPGETPDFGAVPCPVGFSGECYTGDSATRGVGICRPGQWLCYEEAGELVQVCFGEILPGEELCNGLDDDCDGLADNHGVCDGAGIETTGSGAMQGTAAGGHTLILGHAYQPLYSCLEDEAPWDCAIRYLREFSDDLGLTDVNQQALFIGTEALGLGQAVNFVQKHAGFPVRGGTISVRIAGGRVFGVEIRLLDIPGDLSPPHARLSVADLADVLGVGPESVAAGDEQWRPVESGGGEDGWTLVRRLIWQPVPDRAVSLVMPLRVALVDVVAGEVLFEYDAMVHSPGIDALWRVNGQPGAALTGDCAGAELGIEERIACALEHFLGRLEAVPLDTSGIKVDTWPGLSNGHIFKALVGPVDQGCGVAFPSQRTFVVDDQGWVPGEPAPPCVTDLGRIVRHEASHLVFDAILGPNYHVAGEEAVSHGLVEVHEAMISCLAALEAGEVACDWTTLTTAKSPLAAFQEDGLLTLVPKTDASWTGQEETEPGVSFEFFVDNRLLFASPLARTVAAWMGEGGTPADAVRKMQLLLYASVVTLPGPPGDRSDGLTPETMALHLFSTCLGLVGALEPALDPADCHVLKTHLAISNLLQLCDFPSPMEFCNGVDDNCDGLVDNCTDYENCCVYREQVGEDCAFPGIAFAPGTLSRYCFSHGDASKDGVGPCHGGYQACEGGQWSPACVGEHLPAPEVCDPSGMTVEDEDCDGETDEGTTALYVEDKDGDGVPGYGLPDEKCVGDHPGWVLLGLIPGGAARDCNDYDPAIHPGAPELCLAGGVDENCNGAHDDGCPCVDEEVVIGCDLPDGIEESAFCAAGFQKCAWDPEIGTWAWTDCYGSLTGETEVCDGLDNDCDGLTDEDAALDGVGMADAGPGVPCVTLSPGLCAGHVACIEGFKKCLPYVEQEVCDGLDNDCDGMTDEGFDADGDGYLDALQCSQPNASDCDDDNPMIHPGMTEQCDGLDNDCDGMTDEGFDADGDGYLALAFCPNGHDCDDYNGAVHPGAAELCDGMDNNCDGQVDEDLDMDFDGFTVCGVPPDCDDLIGAVFPGANEVCDDMDNDCDGETDEEDAFGCIQFYRDDDGDGFGDPEDYHCTCDKDPDPDSEYTLAFIGGDCNDDLSDVFPGAQPYCKFGCTDGVVDPGEACDDGNADPFGDCWGCLDVIPVPGPDIPEAGWGLYSHPGKVIRIDKDFHVTAFDGDSDSGGSVRFEARSILLYATIDATGKGYGGGGGGGGGTGSSMHSTDCVVGCPATLYEINCYWGCQGKSGPGAGGGWDGDPGLPGYEAHCPDICGATCTMGGAGGQGGGPHGGVSGAKGKKKGPQGAGVDGEGGGHGGYASPGVNGDTSLDMYVHMGSGGGGGGGASGANADDSPEPCAESGGGGGGGAGGTGGGAVALVATELIVFHPGAAVLANSRAGGDGGEDQAIPCSSAYADAACGGGDGGDAGAQGLGLGGFGGLASGGGYPMDNDPVGCGYWAGCYPGGDGGQGGVGAGGGILLVGDTVNIQAGALSTLGGLGAANGGTIKIFYGEELNGVCGADNGRCLIQQSGP